VEIFCELRVEEVMTRDAITVAPQNSMAELEQILRLHRISGTPVLEDGELVGIVSLMDLIQAVGAGQRGWTSCPTPNRGHVAVHRKSPTLGRRCQADT
jgi:CBS domain-containing protein